MIRKKLQAYFFSIQKNPLIVGQFGRKQKQANITKSVFIHGDIVSIYTYVQYKNAQDACISSHPSCTAHEQHGLGSLPGIQAGVLYTACR